MLVVSTVDSGGTRQLGLGIWVEGVHKLAKCLTTSKCNDGWKNVLTDALVDCLRLDVLRERSGFDLCVAGVSTTLWRVLENFTLVDIVLHVG